MAEGPNRKPEATDEAPGSRPVHEAGSGTPAEEWGQREDTARTIAAGGKESEKRAPERH